MSNEIGFTNDKVDFSTKSIHLNSTEKHTLYEALSNEIDINCVKCAKPLNLDFNEKLIRCPFCSDFFKPQAQLIFQVEERIQKLSNRYPVAFFIFDKKIKITILTLLIIGFINYEEFLALVCFFLIFSFVVYEAYSLRHHQVKEFKYLNECLQKLESDYQKNN